MSTPQWYLGAGIQRKGENLEDIIISWASYWKEGARLRLHFGSKTTKDLTQAVRFCYDEFFPYVYFFVYYSMRGSAFYFAKEWEETQGLLSDRKGRVVAYNEDRPDILDGRSTRLAADVEKLRKQSWSGQPIS